MRGFLKIIVLSVLIMCSARVSFASEAEPKPLKLDDSVRLNNIVVTLLTPEIQKAVNDFYSPYLKISPQVVPFLDMKIVDIKGGELIHEGILNSDYTIVVEVLPYVGPHNNVGKDRITLSTAYPYNAKVEKFEHIKSYELPPNYQSIIIKPLP